MAGGGIWRFILPVERAGATEGELMGGGAGFKMLEREEGMVKSGWR